MKLSADTDSVNLPVGATTAVPLKLLRSARLSEPATIRVLIPGDLADLVSAEPVQVPPGQETAAVRLRVARGIKRPGRHDLTFEAVLTQPARLPRMADALHATPLDAESLDLLSRGLLPVISRTTVPIEFSDR